MSKLKTFVTSAALAVGALAFASSAFAAGLTGSQVQSILSLLASFGADSATIANVSAALNGTPVVVSPSFKIGDTGPAVVALQKQLIADGYLKIAAPTGYYGKLTQAAVLAKAASTSSSSVTPVTMVGNGLKVAISSTSPNGTVLVAGQGIGDLGNFVFSNPTATPINVTGLTFKRLGVSNDSTLVNVYLYNGVTRITDSAGVSNGQFSYTDPTALFTVPAGGTYVASVRSDIDSSASGQQIGVSLVSVSSNGTLDSSVVFPISSSYQTVSAATLAGVDFSSVSQSTASISPQSNYPLWQETVSINQNPVKLSSLKLTNLGSIDSSLVQNLRLYVDGVQVGSAAILSDRTATFDFSANPAILNTQNHTIKVVGDIVGGSSRTIELSLQRSSDAMFVDTQLGQPVTMTVNGNVFTPVNGSIITINAVTGSTGISVSIDPASPNQDVALGASSVKWATFDVLVSGENVKLNSLNVSSNVALANGKIYINGSQVGSTKSLGTSAVTFNTSAVLPAGQTSHVEIYADAKTPTGNLSNGQTVIVTLNAGSSNAQGQSSLNTANVPASDTSGNSINVTNSSLSVTRYSGYGSQTIIPGSVSRIGSFTISAGSTEGVTVNTINLSLSAANAASITNLTLKDGSSVLGNVVTTPSISSSYSVNLDILASQTKTIDVYGNVLSGAANGSLVVSVSVSGNGDQTGNTTSSSAVSLQTMTIGSGSLSATVAAGDPVSANIVAGAASINVGQFEFNAVSSAYTIQNLDISVAGTINDVTAVTVTYLDANGNTQTSTQPIVGTVASFSGLNIYVPANDQADVTVSIGTPTIASGAQSGSSVSVGLASSNFRAVDASGRSITTGFTKAAEGTFYVYKSIPTFATLAITSNIPSSGNPLYRFSVTADPKGSIDLSKVTFNLSTTSVSVTNMYVVDEASGLSVGSVGANGAVAMTQQIGAGMSKTYALYGTVGGFTTGSSLTISLAQDTSLSTTNVQWSDRSTTANGYLLKNFTTNATSYSK